MATCTLLFVILVKNLKKTNPDPNLTRIYPIFLSKKCEKVFALAGKKIETRETRVSRKRYSGNVVNRSVAYLLFRIKR